MDEVTEQRETVAPRASAELYDLLDVAGLCVTVALLVVLLLGGRSVVRDVVTLAFTLFVPGWAVLSNWAILKRRFLPLSIVLSLALLALLATITLWLHVWHPVALAEGECGAVIVALSVSLFRRARPRKEEGVVPPG